MNKGLDISSAQGSNIDFASIKNAGYDFVIIECYIGNDNVSADYDNFLQGALAAGLKVGSYHFIYPLLTDPAHPNRDPIGQANLHFNHCKTNLVCIDAEWPEPKDWAQWGCTASQINQWCIDYLKEYTRLCGGKKP